MSKNKRKKQQQKSLPTATVKPTAQLVSAPKFAMVSAPIHAPVMEAPSQAPAPKPVAISAPVTKPVAAPSAPAPKVNGDVSKGTLEGVVVSRTYHSKDYSVLYGRIWCEATQKYYVVHHANGVVPEEGTIVQFTPFTHEQRNGQKSTAAKDIKVIGVDLLVSARMETVNNLPLYLKMKMEDFLNMTGEEKELAEVVGSTPEGDLLYYSKDKRK